VLLFVFTTLIPPFFSGIIGCGSAYLMWRITSAHAAKKAGEGDEKTWRQGRLDAEKALRDAQVKETQERTLWQLKNEENLAKVADILEESAEAHKLLAAIAARTDGHDGRLNRHDTELMQLGLKLETMHGHIHQLALAQHVRPS
jgi:hypothetical protein